MDKNFIRVDDLVRQHLEGAEEQERAGAWLNMRDLLDKEMPQKKRIAAFYWRRLFGLVAVSSLVGTLAVGGYELSSAYRRSDNSGTIASAATAPAVSKETGRPAIEAGSMEMENEPATAGNITVRGNSHIASVAHANSNADADLANTNTNNNGTDNNTIEINNNNTTTNTSNSATTHRPVATTNNNTSNKASRTGTATQAVRSVRSNTATAHTAIANNNDGNNSTADRNTDKTPTAANRREGTHAGNHTVAATRSNVVTTLGSTALPDKPVNSDNTRSAKNSRNNTGHGTTAGRHNNAASMANNTAASADGNIAAGSATTDNNAAKTATAAHHNNTANVAKRTGSNTSSATTDNGLTATVTGHRRAKAQAATSNTGSPATTNSNNAVAGADSRSNNNIAAGTTHSRQDVGVLNSSGPAALATNATPAAPSGTTAVPSGTTASTASATGNTAETKTAVAGKKTTGTGAKTISTKTATAATVAKNTKATAATTASKGASATGTGNTGHATASTTAKTAVVATGHTSGAKNAVSGTAPAKTANTASSTDTYAAAKQNKGNSIGTKTTKGDHAATTSAANEDALASDEPEESIAETKQDPADQKMITKIVVREREVKDNDNQILTKSDTLSMEKVNKESPARKDKEPAPVATTTAKKKGGAASTAIEEETPAVAGATPATTEENNGTGARGSRRKNRHHAASGSDDNGLAASAEGMAEGESAAAPAATPAEEEAASAATATTETKAKTKAAHKHSGVSVLQRLSAAFNDVKTHTTGAKFTGGITAGINSNFFGPGKMKGFQFGMTGNFEFSESWNMMAELKYFHRLNGNTIDDSYYSYTQMGGQYSKQLIQNTYDFAAMHSVEMPLTIRYAKGNFNFYTGGNFLYTFSINTAAATMPSLTVAPTVVAAPGEDNTPKLNSETDFRSRFGLGYIFGFSYQLAPNTALDLRSVQTVWDNAATTGARSLSGQLYRTPSVQLSIMYRLGGNRNKE